MAKAKKKTAAKSPVRKTKAQPKAAATAKTAYQYVTEAGAKEIKKIQKLAEGVLSDVQKRFAAALQAEAGKGGELAKLRKEWLGKRISRTKIGKAIAKKK
jgi:hypothetical protein